MYKLAAACMTVNIHFEKLVMCRVLFGKDLQVTLMCILTIQKVVNFVAGGCYNSHESDVDCDKRAARGDCKRDPSYMKHCERSCDTCLPAAESNGMIILKPHIYTTYISLC